MPDNPFHIRPFERRDIAFAVELAELTGLSHWSSTDYLDEMDRADSIMLTASLDSLPAGFMIGRMVPCANANMDLDAEIYNIGVRPAQQTQGIGARLFAEFAATCRVNKVADIWLEVRASNLPAISFYKKFLFREMSVRPRFYDDPTDDAIVMRLSLSELEVNLM